MALESIQPSVQPTHGSPENKQVKTAGPTAAGPLIRTEAGPSEDLPRGGPAGQCGSAGPGPVPNRHVRVESAVCCC
jgi:hypothetical protein